MTRREMVALLGAAPAFAWAAAQNGVPQPVPFDSVEVAGDLSKRARQNFDRLEAPYYAPPRVFESENARSGRETWRAALYWRSRCSRAARTGKRAI